MYQKCLVAVLAIVAFGAMAANPATEPAGLAAPGVDQCPKISWKQLEGYLSAPKEETVLVDFWATWCVPCREALPDMAKVTEAYKGKPVRVLLVSFDDAEDGPAVREAVAKAGVPFGSYILKAEDRTTLVKEMHPDWKAVVVPASFVYDRRGRQVYHKLFSTHSFKEWQGILGPIISGDATTEPVDHKP